MIYTKFINCSTISAFNSKLELGEISSYDLVFINETKQIWTHDVFYSCPYTKEEIDGMISSGGLTKEQVEKVLTGNITSHTHDQYLTSETDPTVPSWAKQPDKPTYTASEVGAAPTSHTHTKSQITDFPSTLPNPNSLTLKVNSGTTEGTNLYTYNGSSGKSLDIKAGSNVTLSASSGSLTISSTNTTYGTATSSSNGLMSSTDKAKLDTVASNANNYSHPTSSGNKHIPSGGSSGQILRWSADGTAVWGNDNNTTYKQANSTTLGLIKIGFPESGKNYPVELNSSGQAFVNVPWTDNNTTYGVVGGNGSTGLVKNGSSVTSASGYTACPIISGIPYYKDTNTTYSLGSFGITATAAELNKLDGCTATVTELNYLDGVTSNIQTQLNGKAAKNQTMYIGTTSVAINRGSGSLTLNGVNISGSSGSCTGNAATASKLGTSNVGSSSLPIYLNGGSPSACSASSIFSGFSYGAGGEVSLTIAGQNRKINIGQCQKTGGGTSGTAGWVLVMQFVVSSAYQNQPIKLWVSQRGRRGALLTLVLNSVNSTDTTVNSFSYLGEITAARAVKSGTTWKIYVQKSERYDDIGVSILNYHESYMNLTSITYPFSQSNSDPGGTAASLWNPASSAAYVDRERNTNTVTTLTSIPTSKALVIANLSKATTISVASGMSVGDSITVICNPTASFTQPIPTTGAYKSMDGDSLKVTSGKQFEINILCYASGKYSISSKVAK